MAEASTAEQNALSALTRIFAVSLGDEPTRGGIRAAMATQGVTHELKLDFQKLVLTSPGDGLRRHMAASAQISVDSLSALLKTVRPLEVYLPVRSHRTSWTGGSVLVASQLFQSDLPTAYREDGSAIRLSLSTPPAETVISLVPRETNLSQPAFSARVASSTMFVPGRADRSEECEPNMDQCEGPPSSGGPMPGYFIPSDAPPGLYMMHNELFDAKEPWIRGEPEIEAHVMGPGLSDPADHMRALQCSGATEAGYSYFDQNSNGHAGAVLLMTTTRFNQLQLVNTAGDGRKASVVLYEDDDEACIIKDDPNRLLDVGWRLASYGIALLGIAAYNCGDDSNVITCDGGILGAYIQMGRAIWNLFETNDDYLGVAVPASNFSADQFNMNHRLVLDDGQSLNGAIELRWK